jgi:lipoprotein-anchoring transpeptidase ErfK/SrfK
MYFHEGWAIHGSNSVPARPASHGCVRVPRGADMVLFRTVPVGTPVIVYD